VICESVGVEFAIASLILNNQLKLRVWYVQL
jgi:hypothetical protein